MKTRIIIVLLAALTAGLCSCNGGNAPQPQPSTDFDKMIGTWTLNSYTEKWENTTEQIVERDTTINRGTLVIRKDLDEEQQMQYFYTENFLSAEEYEGMILIENGYLNLCAIDGFNRKDLENNYEYAVSFPSDNKMEWTYEWTGTHKRGSDIHQDKRTVKAVFTQTK